MHPGKMTDKVASPQIEEKATKALDFQSGHREGFFSCGLAWKRRKSTSAEFQRVLERRSETRERTFSLFILIIICFSRCLGSPQQLLPSNPCPTTRLLNCKEPEKKTLHRAIKGVHATTHVPHSVLCRPNLQLFTRISSREFDEMEGCSKSL